MTNYALPARRPTVFATPWPLALAGVGASLVVGALIARGLPLGIGSLFGYLYAPVVLLNLPLGVALWIPFTFVDRITAFSVAPTLAAILIALAWIGALQYTRGRVGEIASRHTGMLAGLALFLVWVTASLIWADNTTTAAKDFWHWYVAAAIFLIVATTLVKRRYVEIGCAAFVAGAVVSVLAGAIPNAAPIGTDVTAEEAARLAGSMGDPNILAAALGPAIAVAVGLMAVFRGAAARTLLGLAVVCFCVGLVLSGSRGGLLAAGTMMVIAVAVVPGRRLQLGALAAAATAAVVIVVGLSSSSAISRVRSFDTGDGRIDLWTVAWRMVDDHPITGIGDNNFLSRAPDYLPSAGAVQQPGFILTSPHFAHNTYLQLWAETGIVGLVLLVAFLAAALRSTWLAAQAYDRGGDARMATLARSVFVAQAGYLVALVFLTDGTDKRLWVLLAFWPALLAAARRPQGAL